MLGYSIHVYLLVAASGNCMCLPYVGDEHAKMTKRAINPWMPGEEKIIQFNSILSKLTGNGISDIPSLPYPILSDMSELILV